MRRRGPGLIDRSRAAACDNRRVKKPPVKTMLGAGLLTGVAIAVWRAYRARVPQPATEGGWEAAPFPFPPIPRPAAPRVVSSAEPVDGGCPESHPVKGKSASGIYHVPGGLNYERTHPDRCYVDAAAAEQDGLRPSKI